MHIPAGSTDQSVYFYLQDAVTGGAYTAGGSETDLNLIYQRDGAVQVTNSVVAALASATAAHEDNKVFHCGSGLWRCDFPDAVFAPGADHALLMVTHGEGCFLPAVRAVGLAVGKAVLDADIDSTGQPVTAKKAIEAILAVLAGNSTFGESGGSCAFKGRDGITTVVTNTVTDVGTRTESELP